MRELSRVVSALTQRFYLLVLGAAIIGAATYTWTSTHQHTGVYQATAQVVVAARYLSQGVDITDVNYSTQLAHTYALDPLSSDMVAEIGRNVSGRSAAQIRSGVRLTQVPNQPLIAVTVSDDNGQIAMDLANTTAAAFVDHYSHTVQAQAEQAVTVDQRTVNTLSDAVAQTTGAIATARAKGTSTDSLNRQLQLQQLQLAQARASLASAQRAVAMTQPSFAVAALARTAMQAHPSPLQDGALGALAGLLAGAGLALLLDQLDNTIRGPNDVRLWTQLGTLGTLPLTDGGAGASLSLVSDALVSASSGDLLQNLAFLDAAGRLRLIMVTGADDLAIGSVAVQLAAEFARGGQRTLLIDANWAHAGGASVIALPEDAGGFFAGLIDQAMVGGPAPRSRQPALTAVPNLFALSADPLPLNLAELLDTDLLPRYLEMLRSAFDRIVMVGASGVLDEPGRRLARQADGIILAARGGMTSGVLLAQCAGALRTVDARLLGAVLLDESPPSMRRQRRAETEQRTARSELPLPDALATTPGAADGASPLGGGT